MPPYTAETYINLEDHTEQALWFGETPAPGNGGASASQRVKIPPEIKSFFIDAQFSGAPGAFEVDIQAASVDIDSQYQTILNGNQTAVDPVNFTFHYDGVNLKSKFLRLLMRARTNPVAITARIVV
jgi:hypothetical protein